LHPTAYPVSTSSVVATMRGFASALPPAEAERVLADARHRRFQRGDIVFHEGDPSDTLHLVTEGRFSRRSTRTLSGSSPTVLAPCPAAPSECEDASVAGRGP